MSIENPAVPLSAAFEGTDTFDMLTDGGGTVAGVRVTRNRVLGYSAVWRAVNLIASGVGRLPVEVFRWIEPHGEVRGKRPDYAHRARKVLRRPNECMTPITFRKTLQAHALLDGNGYAYVARDLAAAPTELVPLNPRRTWPVRVDGNLWYVSECGDPIPGKRRRYGMVKIPAADVIHIPGLGYDGLCGYPVVKLLRETFGAALASRDYGARYFANDGRPGIALVVPAGMKEEAVKNLRESWERLHTGMSNAHRAAILRDGVTLQTFGSGARDAQLLENRSFDAREIANVFGVPAHKLGDPSRTAYNSLEAENQGFLDDTLDDWLTTWEQELETKLLTEFEKEAESHVIQFDRRALLRNNLAARTAYYTAGILNGWHNRDEVRAEEGYNPIPDGKGAEFVLPVNVAPVAQPIPPTQPTTDAPPAPAPVADPPAGPSTNAAPLVAVLRQLAADTFGRMVRRVGTGAERLAGRPGDLSAYLAAGARQEHRDQIAAAAAPFVTACRASGRACLGPGDLAAAILSDLAEAIRPRLARQSDRAAAVREAVAAVESSTPARLAADLFPEE